MRNKETCIRLIEKIEVKLQSLLSILGRPNANAKEFSDVINESKDTLNSVKSFIDREQETM